MPAMVLSHLVDWVRRKVGQQPKVDIVDAQGNQLYPDAYGQPSPQFATLTTPQVKQCIMEAIDEVNRTAFVGSSPEPRTISFEAVDSDYQGTLSIDLNTGFQGAQYVGAIGRIEQAWVDIDDALTPIRMTTLAQYQKENPTWMTSGPGVPYIGWVEGYHFYLYPAPSSDGDLKFIAQEGLHYPLNDNDYIDQLASDEYTIIGLIAARNVCAMFPNDQNLSATYNILKADGDRAVLELAANVSRRAGDTVMPQITPAYRYLWPSNRRR